MNAYDIDRWAYRNRWWLMLALLVVCTFDGCDPEPEPCYSDGECISMHGVHNPHTEQGP